MYRCGGYNMYCTAVVVTIIIAVVVTICNAVVVTICTAIMKHSYGRDASSGDKTIRTGTNVLS